MSKLLCPACHSPELATIEQAIAMQPIRFEREPDGSLTTTHPVAAQLDWDTSKTIGLSCQRCGWTHKASNWVALLMPACARCDAPITDHLTANLPVDGSALCAECGEDWETPLPVVASLQGPPDDLVEGVS